MGRRPDSAQVQAAKGNPGRRRTAVEKRAERAQAVAALIARSLDERASDDVPAYIAADPVASTMWQMLGPVLIKTHRLQPQHRPMFITFCTYYAQWVMANEGLDGGKYTQRVKTVAGGMMDRINPLVRVRDDAHKKCLELSKLFGLTPADEYDLFKVQRAAAAAGNSWLFGDEAEHGQPAAPEEKSEEPSLIAALGGLDSVPPGTGVH